MNRALPLIVLTAAIAAGLFFFSQTDSGPPLDPEEPASVADSRGPAPAPAVSDDEPEDSGPSLAAVSDTRPSVSASAGSGPTKSWEIIPMNEIGQSLKTATIVAEHGDLRLEGVGRTKFDAAPSGVWTVRVEEEGLPIWKSEVKLRPGRNERTGAKLGESFQIRGVVVDSNGDPIAKTPVFLLQKGIAHPERGDLYTTGPNASGAKSGPSGLIYKTTGSRGEFAMKVPKTGMYHFSVGPASNARWTERKSRELANGGPSFARIVVPAMPQVELTFAGEPEARPTQVSAYAYDAELAMQLAAQELERMEMQEQAEALIGEQKEAKRRAQERGGAKGAENYDAGRDAAPAGKGRGRRNGPRDSVDRRGSRGALEGGGGRGGSGRGAGRQPDSKSA